MREPAQTQTQDGSGCMTFWLFAHALVLIPRRVLGLPVVWVKIAQVAVVASWMSGCLCLWRDSPAPLPYRAKTCSSEQASDLPKVTEQVGSRTGLCLPAGTLHRTVDLPRGPQSGPGPHYTETSSQPSPLWIITALFS